MAALPLPSLVPVPSALSLVPKALASLLVPQSSITVVWCQYLQYHQCLYLQHHCWCLYLQHHHLVPVPSAPSLGACTFSTIGACTFSTIIGVKSSSNIMLKALQHHCQCQTSMNVLYFWTCTTRWSKKSTSP